MAKTALITGSSTGIGYGFVKVFAENNYNLVITARNGAKLQEIADEIKNKYNVNVKVLPKDLSKQNAANEIFNELKNNNIKINVLINNSRYAALPKCGHSGSFRLNAVLTNLSSPPEADEKHSWNTDSGLITFTGMTFMRNVS